MAFGKLSGDSEGQPQSEINMIPLIDVMLVLLIVFMITAPLLSNAVKVDLPQASSSPEDIRKDDIKLAIKVSGEMFWNGELVSAINWKIVCWKQPSNNRFRNYIYMRIGILIMGR